MNDGVLRKCRGPYLPRIFEEVGKGFSEVIDRFSAVREARSAVVLHESCVCELPDASAEIRLAVCTELALATIVYEYISSGTSLRDRLGSRE